MASQRIVIGIISFFSISTAFAQSIETVLISASHVPLRLSEIGTAISVIDAATLEQRQLTHVFDALREVPGIAVSRTGTVGSLSQIRMRGSEANHTLVLIDGVEANDPAASSEFNFAHLLSAGIERIEVLRGPQSALWGADALAGVINVITETPKPGFSARGAAEGGSFGTWQVTGLANGGNERAGAVLHGSYFDSAGNNISRTGDEKDGYSNLTLGGRGFFSPLPSVTLSGSLRHAEANSGFDSGFPYPVDSDDESEAVQTYGRAQAKGIFLDGALDAVLGASLTRTRTENFSAGTFSDSIAGDKDRFDLLINGNWAGTLGGAPFRQRVSLLGETAEERFEQRFVSLAIADQDQSFGESGAALEYWAGYDERMFFSLGARQDWNSRFADAATWRVTWSAILPYDARLHASAGTGVKNPDFYELYGFVPSSFVGNPDLKPEKSLGTDVGMEVNLFSRLRLDVTYFHANLENEIFTDFAAFPSTALNAAGESTRQGVEVEGRAALGMGWTISGAYTWTDSEEDGAAELRRPEHIGSVDLDGALFDGRLHLNLGADFQGEVADTDFGTFQQVTLPGYTLLRAAASVRIGDELELFGRVENALDEEYEDVVGYRARGFGVFAGLRARIGE